MNKWWIGPYFPLLPYYNFFLSFLPFLLLSVLPPLFGTIIEKVGNSNAFGTGKAKIGMDISSRHRRWNGTRQPKRPAWFSISGFAMGSRDTSPRTFQTQGAIHCSTFSMDQHVAKGKPLKPAVWYRLSVCPLPTGDRRRLDQRHCQTLAKHLTTIRGDVSTAVNRTGQAKKIEKFVSICLKMIIVIFQVWNKIIYMRHTLHAHVYIYNCFAVWRQVHFHVKRPFFAINRLIWSRCSVHHPFSVLHKFREQRLLSEAGIQHIQTSVKTHMLLVIVCEARMDTVPSIGVIDEYRIQHRPTRHTSEGKFARTR